MTAPAALALQPEELAAFRRRPRLTVPQAIEYDRRMLASGPRKDRPYRNQDAPHLIFPMEVFEWPSVRELVVAAANQVGKTTFAHNCLFVATQHWGSPAMEVLQDELTCDKVMRDLIIRTLRATPAYRANLTDISANTALKRISFANGATLYAAWGSSDITTETFTVETLHIDEPDFWPPPRDLERVKRRTTAYPHTHKIVITCKPMTETGPTWQAFLAADVRYYAHFLCLACHRPSRFANANLRYPAEHKSDPALIRRERLARYHCPHCDHPHDDHGRDRAVTLAQQEGLLYQPDVRLARPVSVGVQIPAIVSSFVSLSQLAYEWLRAQQALARRDIEPLRTYVTSRLAEPFVEHRSARAEEHVYLLREERPRGVVPPETVALIAGCDNQDDGCYYVIRAVTLPDRVLTSHLVREGYVSNLTGDDLDQLDRLVFGDTYSGPGGQYQVHLAGIDAMGHRTASIYDLCRRRPGLWFPLKGNQRQAKHHFATKLDTYPGGNRPLPGGLNLQNLDVTFYKNELDRRLRIPRDEPGSWRMHQDLGPDYAAHLISEYRDPDTGCWVCPASRPNHYWDCEVYCLAMMDIFDLKFWPSPADLKAREEAAKTAAAPRAEPRRPRPW